APEALPARGDRAGIAIQDRNVERTDIDAEFERRSRHHTIDAAGAQRALGGATRGWQIAAAVGANALGLARIRIEHVLEVFGQDFDHEPRLREDDRLELRA